MTANTTSTVEIKQSGIYNYINWFEKVDINTVIWQVIVLIIIFNFAKEIKLILKGLVSKIPQIKTIAGVEFQLSVETQNEIEEKEEELKEEIEPYETVTKENSDIVFINHFIDFERSLGKLYTKVFYNSIEESYVSTHQKLHRLVKKGVIDHKAISAYSDIRRIRNNIVHGINHFTTFEEAKPYLQVVFLLKDFIKNGFSKATQQEFRFKSSDE